VNAVCLIRIEVLVVVALVPYLLAERYVETDDLFTILVDFSLQVYVVLLLYLFKLLQPLIPLLSLLLLLLPQLIFVLLLILQAQLIDLVLQRTAEAVLK
jgi:hypothetical protein